VESSGVSGSNQRVEAETPVSRAAQADMWDMDYVQSLTNLHQSTIRGHRAV